MEPLQNGHYQRLFPVKKSSPTLSELFLKPWNPTVPHQWGAFAAVPWALMDAGVPISAPVAGVAMGLIKEKTNTRYLQISRGMRTTWEIWTSK